MSGEVPAGTVDLTPAHLFLRGNHLPADYTRIGAHADELEAALVGVDDARAKASADRNLTDDGVRDRAASAASAALGSVQAKTEALAEKLEKEAAEAGGNPYHLTMLDGVSPEEAGARRQFAAMSFVELLQGQPEDRRELWARQRLMEAAAADRRALLGGVYELVADLGPGAYGLTEALLADVQEAHFRARDPKGVETRDARRMAAQLVRANGAKAERTLRTMGA